MAYAIVTGGSRGLGAGIARMLGENGYDVVVNYVSESSKEKAEAVAEDVRKSGVKALVIRADVSKREGCQSLFDAAVAEFGSDIAVLVNNAGISQSQGFVQTSLDRIEEIVDINLMSFLNMSRLTYPVMAGNGGGCVINITSTGGINGAPGQTVYAATKAGMIGFTKAMAAEYGPAGIRTNAVAPGLTDTDIIKPLGEAVIEAVKAKNPLRDMGRVEDIVDAAEYILKARFLNGQTIAVDGGSCTSA